MLLSLPSSWVPHLCTPDRILGPTFLVQVPGLGAHEQVSDDEVAFLCLCHYPTNVSEDVLLPTAHLKTFLVLIMPTCEKKIVWQVLYLFRTHGRSWLDKLNMKLSGVLHKKITISIHESQYGYAQSGHRERHEESNINC
jgi:hypothetical protein